ncbi:UTRA domain-containing protein [uncultured Cohaesibacter sp.]|uniref:UTRA domain-containing protein n=1 Tax=uncultured Cohaesibacter sp. TaxID=1002546 RepID=UPI00292DD45C|nr:UTRA domain-containing protein [uncultured Cohaesibacter sp.]
MEPETTAKSNHVSIKADILEKIVDGTWQPGYQLPIETDLATHYGVSRMTMNKVLTQLHREGYVYRRKRKGTFVAEPRVQSAVMEIVDIEQEVLALNKSYHWQLLDRQCRHLLDAEKRLLKLEEASDLPILHIQGMHFCDDKPFCLETRLINPETVPSAHFETFEKSAPGGWLLKELPWTKAVHEIRAVNVSAEEATLLAIDKSEACLQIDRQTEIDANWVTRARLLYPGSSHQLIAQF